MFTFYVHGKYEMKSGNHSARNPGTFSDPRGVRTCADLFSRTNPNANAWMRLLGGQRDPVVLCQMLDNI